MSANVVADRVLAEFKGTGAHLASSNLSSEQEAKAPGGVRRGRGADAAGVT